MVAGTVHVLRVVLRTVQYYVLVERIKIMIRHRISMSVHSLHFLHPKNVRTSTKNGKEANQPKQINLLCCCDFTE